MSKDVISNETNGWCTLARFIKRTRNREHMHMGRAPDNYRQKYRTSTVWSLLPRFLWQRPRRYRSLYDPYAYDKVERIEIERKEYYYWKKSWLTLITIVEIRLGESRRRNNIISHASNPVYNYNQVRGNRASNLGDATFIDFLIFPLIE